MKQNPDYILEEYKMMRQEILQYLQEYQTVRNMMYVVTGAILAIGIDSESVYLLLLPLIVIIPSYLIAVNYWDNVNKAASYLQVFCEKEMFGTDVKERFPIQWETRLDSLKKSPIVRNSGKQSPQFMPYRVTAVMCHVLYFVRIIESDVVDLKVASGMSDERELVFLMILGIITAVISFTIIHRIKPVEKSEYISAWRSIRKMT